MDNGILISLAFAAAIVLLSVVLSLIRRPRRRRADLNASRRDGAASATWIGMHQARKDPDGED